MSSTFRFSGRIGSGNLLHSTKEDAPDGALIPPSYVSTKWGSVPQYAPTVREKATGYDPAGDCNGYFMSYKYQPNNNCYNYACNMATNSFAQPGRGSGAPSFWHDLTAEHVKDNAVSDGLVYIGTTLADVEEHAKAGQDGHYIALMISPPESNIGNDPKANWPGDYHWARCDDLAASSWSQKDGGDQVTNFDFAGMPITNPASANWRVNQGPISPQAPGQPVNPNLNDNNEYVVSYAFYCFMFVPNSSINII